jgi:hypothetical protein
MQEDPVRYFQDLIENYRQMSDGELLQLAEKPEDLTDVAQQVLRDEISRRRLEKAKPAAMRPRTSFDPSTHVDVVGGPFADRYAPPPVFEELEDGEAAPEYTWKTLLHDCETNEHALQLAEALKRQGIESWVRQVSPYSTDIRGPQVYVAADQLEPAQAIAAQPIPQDIVDDFKLVIPEFELPVCPQCGSTDEVMLESADPVNAWLCEACGAEWSDPDPAENDDSAGGKSSAQ